MKIFFLILLLHMTVMVLSSPQSIPVNPPAGQRCRGRNFGERRCCTPQNPCGLGEGDCDGELDGGQHDGNGGCRAGLVCGSNNCRKFGLYYHEKDDCCESSSGVYQTWSQWSSFGACYNGKKTRFRNCSGSYCARSTQTQDRRCKTGNGYNFVYSDAIQFPITGQETWRLVRHVPQGASWHEATDRLRGTDVYGNPKYMSEPWSVYWNSDHFNEFLFASGDFKNWAIIRKSDLVGEDGEKYYSNVDIDIQLSSVSCQPYKAKMYRRKGNNEDPWVSIRDHGTARTMVYGSASVKKHIDLLQTTGGMNVYIRKNYNQGYDQLNENVKRKSNCNPVKLLGKFS